MFVCFEHACSRLQKDRTWSRPFSYDQLRELCCQQIIRPMMRIRHPESAFFNMPPTILLTQRHLIRNLNHVRSFGVNVPGKTIIIVILEIRFRLDSERQSFSLEVEANRTFYFPKRKIPFWVIVIVDGFLSFSSMLGSSMARNEKRTFAVAEAPKKPGGSPQKRVWSCRVCIPHFLKRASHMENLITA